MLVGNGRCRYIMETGSLIKINKRKTKRLIPYFGRRRALEINAIHNKK